MVELLSQAGQGAGKMAAGSPRLASDQRRALVERVAVLVMERHDGALRAREAAVAAVEVQIGILGRLPVDVAGFGEPEPWKQAGGASEWPPPRRSGEAKRPVS